MNSKRIVITGAPGTGKTKVVEGLEAKGYRCFHEIIRSMTAQAKNNGTTKKQVSNPLVFVDDPFEFNRQLLAGRIKHFRAADNSTETFSFFDRGIPDVLAYMDYFKQDYGIDFENATAAHQYDALFIMPPWKAIYVSDNERLETFEEAEALHSHLMEAYQRFGYQPIIVPKTSIEQRISFILNTLNSI
ncbi:ATP-binding protein [uncultured Croceitalea sp.]|uniref:ATP-binding protein n=1 Tax=uncultured Croceitalea sp. TaxID=1798908 RepID=UPI0033065F7B